MTQNHLLLRTLRGETVERPPVWMMRQAGRFLPQYRALKERYSFFERVRTPELAAAITRMPVDELDVDAAIIFSDILVVPDAMGCAVVMEEGKGPWLPNPIRSHGDVKRLRTPNVEADMSYMEQSISRVVHEIGDRVPVIGFAGAPWTVMCYMVEGKGSKDWELTRRFLVERPDAARDLLDRITETTINYVQLQIRAGASVIQFFDSWAGALSPSLYRTWMVPIWQRLVESVRDVPVILFARGAHICPTELASLGDVALGLDWSIDPKRARELVPHRTLQGNLDPVVLFADDDVIVNTTTSTIDALGVQRTIVNLGHGILPQTPVEKARTFVQTVKDYRS